MRVVEALSGVSRLFLDTSPVVYFVEENPDFLPIVSIIFEQIEHAALVGIAAPVTLAECLVVPCRTVDVDGQREFVELLTNTENIEFVDIGQQVGQRAGELRAKYNLQLPDSLQIATALDVGCKPQTPNISQARHYYTLPTPHLQTAVIDSSRWSNFTLPPPMCLPP